MPLSLNTRIVELHRHDVGRLSAFMSKKLAVAVAAFADKSEPDDATVEDGAIKAKPDPLITEDLFTKETFGDFELQFEWKIAKGSNAGLKYRIQDTIWLPDDSKTRGEQFEVSMGRVVANPLERKALKPGGRLRLMWLVLNTR